MDRLFIRLADRPDISEKLQAFMKAKKWKGQTAGEYILEQFLLGGEVNGSETSEGVKITPPKRDAAKAPIEDIVAIYHQYCPDLPQTRKAGDKLVKQINARYKEDMERQTGVWWRRYFSQVSESDFLSGRKTDWKANLLWLTAPSNMEKVLCGQYDNHQAQVESQRFDKKTQQNIANLQSWVEKGEGENGPF